MSRSLPEMDDQYWDMNTGAHRRPAPLIGPPSLVWHRAFWMPPSQPNRESWIREVDDFLLCLIIHLRDHAKRSNSAIISQNIEEGVVYLFRHKSKLDSEFRSLDSTNEKITGKPNTDGSPYRPNIVSVSLKISNVYFTFRAQIRSEFWTFGIFSDFSDILESGFVENPALKDMSRKFDEIYSIALNRYENSGDEPIDLSDDIYSKLVDSFRKYCDFLVNDGVNRVGGKKIEDCCGGIFGDFVGLVLGMRPSAAGGHKGIERVQSTRGQPIPTKVAIDYNFELTSLRILDAIWPVVRRLHGGFNNGHKQIEEAQGKPEYAVSLFQRGRVLYVSALGRLFSRKLQNAPEPVTYTLVSIHASRWQLGRLVDRLHELGTLRLAAVRDLQNLMKINEDLRLLRLDLLEGHPLTDIQRRLVKAEEMIPNGLAYRVERSRYYVGRFKSLCSQLGISRVEGFQQYDELVERRLADKFDLIDKIGIRYDDLRRALRDKEQSELQIHFKNQNKTTHTLLETAEFFISISLIYYVGMIIKYSFHFVDYQNFALPFLIVVIYWTRKILKKRKNH